MLVGADALGSENIFGIIVRAIRLISTSSAGFAIINRSTRTIKCFPLSFSLATVKRLIWLGVNSACDIFGRSDKQNNPVARSTLKYLIVIFFYKPIL